MFSGSGHKKFEHVANWRFGTSLDLFDIFPSDPTRTQRRGDDHPFSRGILKREARESTPQVGGGFEDFLHSAVISVPQFLLRKNEDTNVIGV
jgi:hypothetical protein